MQNFQHEHSAHCESGVTSLLLKHKGLDISEPFAFGLGSGLSFTYLPIVKISGMPLIAYRSLPKSIIKKSTKRLGMKLELKLKPLESNKKQKMNWTNYLTLGNMLDYKLLSTTCPISQKICVFILMLITSLSMDVKVRNT